MKIRIVLTGTATLLLLTGCFKSKAEEAAEQVAAAGQQMADAMAGAGAAVTGGEFAGTATEAVDFRELRGLLPEDLSAALGRF